jgi:hypothetical protein
VRTEHHSQEISMRRLPIDADLRQSAQVHARLLEQFVAITRKELERHESEFVQESLTELLGTLREERRSYGILGAVGPVAADAGDLDDAA